MANTDLTTQHKPADTSNALNAATNAVSFQLAPGGKVSVQCDVDFYTWFSEDEDTTVPTKAMAWAAADVPTFNLRGAGQKAYLCVQAQAGTGTAKVIQE